MIVTSHDLNLSAMMNLFVVALILIFVVLVLLCCSISIALLQHSNCIVDSINFALLY